MIQRLIIFCTIICTSSSIFCQTFTRTELPATFDKPWEITYGPDGFLWLTDVPGEVVRVDPSIGEKDIVYITPDYFAGSPLEDSEFCNRSIGKGTLGLALHPDFMDPATSYIYYVYSYNSGTDENPATKFAIKRLTWDAANNQVVADTNIVTELPTGFDHLGGRLMSIKQEGKPYLILSIGDNGRVNSNDECYASEADNPNNFTQDINYKNGKIHRYNMDGTIPEDNPVAGNSFYTRGHRNPQGLMYNPETETLYDIEHGADTDDEINILHKGMNYGWKNIGGFHGDNSIEGEANYVENYAPNPLIENDVLVEPLYAWCTEQSTSSSSGDWCTVAPSDGIYYGSDGIPEWTNSLLVVTLKNASTTDQEVFQFKLKENGELVESTADNPNPKKFFGEDQNLNGRLRDITTSPDGKVIYLINNSGATTSKITVYTYMETNSTNSAGLDKNQLLIFPNPANDKIAIEGIDEITKVDKVFISSLLGQSNQVTLNDDFTIDILGYKSGIYFLHIHVGDNVHSLSFVKK